MNLTELMCVALFGRLSCPIDIGSVCKRPCFVLPSRFPFQGLREAPLADSFRQSRAWDQTILQVWSRKYFVQRGCRIGTGLSARIMRVVATSYSRNRGCYLLDFRVRVVGFGHLPALLGRGAVNAFHALLAVCISPDGIETA